MYFLDANLNGTEEYIKYKDLTDVVMKMNIRHRRQIH